MRSIENNLHRWKRHVPVNLIHVTKASHFATYLP